jgi:tetratricopeptide (TPR) repeat protein|tara:strand:- start:113 stop:613 length:501 start_codon:yes stop_codon:yes gene_type:complete
MKILTFIFSVLVLVACNNIDVNKQLEYGIKKYEQDSLAIALNTFNSIISQTDTSKKTYFLRFLVNVDMQHYEAALKDIEKLEILDSGMAYIYANKGALFYAQNNYEEALVNYKIALQKNPELTLMYNTISHMLFATGKKDEACDYYIKSIENGKTDFDEQITEYCK